MIDILEKFRRLLADSTISSVYVRDSGTCTVILTLPSRSPLRLSILRWQGTATVAYSRSHLGNWLSPRDYYERGRVTPAKRRPIGSSNYKNKDSSGWSVCRPNASNELHYNRTSSEINTPVFHCEEGKWRSRTLAPTPQILPFSFYTRFLALIRLSEVKHTVRWFRFFLNNTEVFTPLWLVMTCCEKAASQRNRKEIFSNNWRPARAFLGNKSVSEKITSRV